MLKNLAEFLRPFSSSTLLQLTKCRLSTCVSPEYSLSFLIGYSLPWFSN